MTERETDRQTDRQRQAGRQAESCYFSRTIVIATDSFAGVIEPLAISE